MQGKIKPKDTDDDSNNMQQLQFLSPDGKANSKINISSLYDPANNGLDKRSSKEFLQEADEIVQNA